jgi:phosphopantothenoylcysteine decarboxylase/phosphopantothenate--cysteine ligase
MTPSLSPSVPPSSKLFKAMPLRCLITAGPTREFFDPVRFVSNPSTGKMGFALAKAAKAAGWTVDLVSGPVSLPEPEGVMFYPVVTSEELMRQTDALFGPCDILIMTAAVSDWRPKQILPQKLKKEGTDLSLEMEPVPDILAAMAAQRKPGQLLVGFAAETENIEEHALAKLKRKKIDLIAANSVAGVEGAFGNDDNTIILLGNNGFRQVLGPASKDKVADLLIQQISHIFSTRPV